MILFRGIIFYDLLTKLLPALTPFTVPSSETVKGVKAGKATITAKLVIGKDTATATKEVEVKNYVLSTVAQNKLTELTATVTGDTKNLKASDFTVKSEATNVVYPVSWC